ncbi:MAG: type VI secretion system baseplate subunit TssK [Planctomycetota bacterium]|jgi:type VI secretion system ImpJ/VasE family protein
MGKTGEVEWMQAGEVHWEEGLFLQPHHLQWMQHRSMQQQGVERRTFNPYPYGLIEASVSRDQLENLLVRFDTLRVIMPSGLYVHVGPGGNADLPAVDITKTFQASSQPLVVKLGVPLWYPDRANTVDGTGDWRVKRLFRVDEVERPDENTGENPQPLRLRRINARLLVQGDDEADLETIPLVRIAHAEGEQLGLPRQDGNFVPPCAVLRASPAMHRLVRDLANAIDASRRELLVQITRAGFSIETIRGAQLEQLLRLQSLSRAAARLPHLVEAPAITPFAFYIELRTILAELAALHPDRDPSEVPDYRHDTPYPAFSELDIKIRALLRGAVAPSFIKADFALAEGIFSVALTDEHLQRPNEYYLAIKTKEDPVALARLVEDGDKFKLMPTSLTGRAIRGVKLVEERHPPLQLPSEVDLHYFRMVRADNARVWERVEQDRGLTAQWPNCEVGDTKLTLYMPIADGGGA